MNIVEVYPGSAVAPNAQFIELQAYSSGQNFVQGHSIVVFNATGGEIGRVSFPFSATYPHGYDQVRFLIATSTAQNQFGITADLILPQSATNNLLFSPAGGQICFDPPPFPIDCVSWGNYSGPNVGGGNPFRPTAGLSLGVSMQRDLGANGQLDFSPGDDDSNNSAADFALAARTPRNNAFTYRSVTMLQSSQNPSQRSQAVTFTAASTSISGGTPRGNVTFLDGTTVLATVPLNGAGQAQHTTSSLTAGTHSITAKLVATAATPPASPTLAGFGESVSPPLSQVVEQTEIRGDANENGTVESTDILFLLSSLFGDGSPPSTLLAGDANSSGAIEVGDIFFLVNHLFTGGPGPAP